MKKFTAFLLVYALLCMTLAGCAAKNEAAAGGAQSTEAPAAAIEGTSIVLSDEGVTVDGAAAPTDDTAAVYVANDIVYYEAGKDFTYGEGTEADAHSQAEADSHTVVHITQAGTYVLSGSLSAGQVAIDLGDGAKEDPSAVVTLVLNGVDITSTLAPAVIFYEVYECGSDDEAVATKDVDTSAAGANVVIADGTENNIAGSYVARIYRPESVKLSEDGTKVEESKKLHKYDGAFYSRQSMNITGGEAGTGILNITAENEGLDSELHLTVNGGNINITSGNDGINTNEDGISVTTINGGNLNIVVTGATGEGDGIDSNGWLVINGGTVTASACSFSGDSGIDSDKGIYVSGGTVIASGNMYDRLEEGGQNYAIFTFARSQSGGSTYTLKNAAGEEVLRCAPVNDFTYLVVSSPDLAEGDYTFWQGETQLGTTGAGMGGFGGGQRPMAPNGMEKPDMGDRTPPEGMEKPDMEGMTPPDGMEKPDGKEHPEGGRDGFTRNEDGTITLPDGTTVDPSQMGRPEEGKGAFGGPIPQEGQSGETAERSAVFTVTAGGSFFGGIGAME